MVNPKLVGISCNVVRCMLGSTMLCYTACICVYVVEVAPVVCMYETHFQEAMVERLPGGPRAGDRVPDFEKGDEVESGDPGCDVLTLVFYESL